MRRAPATPAARPVPAPAAVPSAAATAAAPLGLRPVGIDTMDWPALQAAVAGCEACSLCRSRKNTMFGVGDTQAEIPTVFPQWNDIPMTAMVTEQGVRYPRKGV